MNAALGLVWAAVATAGFAVLFELHLREVPLAATGAILGWGVYTLSGGEGGTAVACFAAAAAVGVYAELLAALRRRPAAVYIVCAIIPIVPGGGMYYTMLASVRGDLAKSLELGFRTLQAAGAIAAGLAVSSAIARLISLERLARRLGGRREKPRI